MAVNRIILNGQTQIDLSHDTAEESHVVAGRTFHKRNGLPAVGTLVVSEDDIATTELNQKLENRLRGVK
jgi:hypothetical protein